ncbi:hypothetical protein ACKWRH_10590 [Bradyrhizobium sp. Pa8]|uniref:hypothetical protein n=1 Tax=Bradyrhizobium sp. Pa8 TaxID=3386552 RepID=UPI00403F4BA8
MKEFNLSMLRQIISGKPEMFSHEHGIRFLQFRVWLLFPEESEYVDAVGKWAATSILREYESDHGPRGGFGRPSDRTSKILVGFLKDDSYARLYDAMFGTTGWTSLVDTPRFGELNRCIQTRRGEVDTVCDMIDFRFRAVEHGALTPKKANIGAGELYVCLKQGPEKRSWRTVRKRWKNLKQAAPFLYASERLGFDFLPPELDGDELELESVNRAKLRHFLQAAAYVASKIEHVDEDDWIEELRVVPKAPKTTALKPSQLEFMRSYKELVREMRST